MAEKVPSETESTSSTQEGPVYPRYVSWLHKLDAFGVEARGIERVTPQERKKIALLKRHSRTRQFILVAGLWFAACGGLTLMSSFFLPTLVYGLDLKNALVSGLIAMIIGCLVPAYCSTMGAKSGCRQMVSARFLFGPWGIRFVSLICIVGGVGWSVVNCVLGGQVLAAILGVDVAVGIVVISVASLVVAVFGIKILLRFQTALAVPITIAVILLYVVVLQKRAYIPVANEMVHLLGMNSATATGNWLSFFTVGYSVTATWGSGASDYYILFPEDTPSYQVFLMTFLGISVPTTFVAIIGTYAGTIAYAYQPWNDAYGSNGVGGILNSAFVEWGRFGQFVVVVLFLSLVCNNIMNTYSCAFEFQLIDRRLALVPRWCWAVLITVIYLVLSLAGKSHFSTILSNFLPMLGYWISMYITLLLEENFLFRSFNSLKKLHSREFETPGSWIYMYNWDLWNRPENITLGIAAALSFAVGVAGAVLGMNQVYYRGVLAAKIGDDGGDIGFWLCMAFCGVAYPPLRYLELRRFGR